MKFQYFIIFPTLAVICQTYEGYLPGLGRFNPARLRLLPAYNRHPRQILDKPKDDPGSKCQYVQMKGAGIPGSDCQPGGMACEENCALVDIDNPDSSDADRGCVTVMQEMCGDVSKEECDFVDEKICEPIAEEICDEDVSFNEIGNQTRYDFHENSSS